ncbi:hypothetical protein BRC88_06480 [Halobacteriales archaeon QS_4_69_225]|nr:MAG: hypothetical protein BRC88_06480 [Halobacteriales archaeon QS_4_69_225]
MLRPRTAVFIPLGDETRAAMARGAEMIGLVLLFDVVVIGGYLLVTKPLGNVVWIVPTFVLFGLVVAAYLYGRLSDGTA